jgi:hypothetical protein
MGKATCKEIYNEEADGERQHERVQEKGEEG